MRRALPVLAAALLAAASVACGNDNSGSGSVTPAGDGGGVTPEDGGTAAPDGGSTGGQPGADGGTSTGGQPDSGPIASSDAGSPDAGTADECAGLSPAPVPAPSASAENVISPTDLCEVGTSDGNGNVALTTSDGRVPSNDALIVYTPIGAHAGNFVGESLQITEQAEGFLIARTDVATVNNMPIGDVTAIDGHANVVGNTSTPVPPVGAVVDPLGGLVAAEPITANGVTTGFKIVSFDTSARVRWSVTLAGSSGMLATGVDRAGNTLVLRGAANVSAGLTGVWIDHSGNAGLVFIAPSALLSGVAIATSLFPRVGNGLFLRDETGTWVAQFEPFGAFSAPPAWLTQHNGQSLHMARGGQAYAMIQANVPNASGCASFVEVVAPSGKSCGTARFSGDASCNLGIGFDGTAIQSLATVIAPGSTNHKACRWQWWTGFFK
jgi:hypothetical protein